MELERTEGQKNNDIKDLKLANDEENHPSYNKSGITTEEKFRRLYEISNLTTENIEKRLGEITQIATKIFGLDQGIVSKIEKNKFTILSCFPVNNNLKPGLTFNTAETYCDLVIKVSDVLMINHMKTSYYESHPCYKTFGLEAYIGIPIYVKGKIWGTINFSSPHPKSEFFTEEDKHMIKILSSWIGNIIEANENFLALKKSETSYKQIVENGLALLCIHDYTGIILQVNKTIVDELGYSKEEIIGKNLKEFIPNNNQDQFDEYLKRIKKQRKDAGLLSILTKKGELKFWSYQNTSDKDHIVGFSQDVTAKIHSDHAISKMQANLREAQSIAKLGSWTYNYNSNVIDWSDEIYNIFERDPKQGKITLEQSIEAIHSEDREKYIKSINDKINNDKSFDLEYRLVLSDNKIKYVKSKSRLIVNPSKGLKILVGTIQDITDQVMVNQELIKAKEASEKITKELLESEQNFKEAQKLAKMGSWKIEIYSGEVIWSEEMSRIYELDPAQGNPSLETLTSFVPYEQKVKLQKVVEEAILYKKSFAIQYEIHLKNHKVKYIQAFGRPSLNKWDQVTHLVGSIQDITDQIISNRELIQAKEVAEEAARVKQEFLANMSHEIRTPMNAITGFSRLLLKAGLNEENTQYVQSIYDSAETLLVIINDILDFSKIEAGKLPIVPEHFSLFKLLTSLEKLFSVKVGEGSVQLKFSVDNNIPPALIGDPARISQILNNIIGNAIKFTEKGVVSVKVQLKEVKANSYLICLSVQDTGIGIAEDKLQTIFNSFEQAEGNTTRRFGGTGLGLTIVKKLVELMDGNITVESTINVGSTFTITLPLHLGNSDKIVVENLEIAKMSAVQKLKNRRILLAEDNRYNQVLAKKFLSEIGCKVVIANNGLEAIELLKQKDFDIILMDIQMPEMDGIQATEIIKDKAFPKNQIPIVAMTAHALKEEEEKFMKIGMIDHISKPFKPEILYGKLLNVLEGEIEITHKNIDENLNDEYPPDLINFSMLQDYLGDDPEFIIEMLRIFVEDVPKMIKSATEALENKDLNDLRKSLHKLKSSLGFMNLDNTIATIQSLDHNQIHKLPEEIIDKRLKFILQNSENAVREAIIVLEKA